VTRGAGSRLFLVAIVLAAAVAGRYSARNGGAGSAMKQNPILALRAE